MNKRIFNQFRPSLLLIIDTNIKTFFKDNLISFFPFTKKHLKKIVKIIENSTLENRRIRPFQDRDWKDKLKEMNKPGKPDYFVFKEINKKTFFSFVEYKSNGDELRPEQINWFRKYHKLPLVLIYSKKKAIEGAREAF